MRDFRDHGDRMFQEVQILNGPRSRAIIQRAPDSSNVSDQFIIPRLTARVRHTSLVKTGSLIQDKAGKIFLCCDHMETSVWRTHLLLPCDRQVTWERNAPVIDVVTSLPRAGAAPQLMGNPWVYWERPTRPQTDYTTRIPDVDYVVATGSPIQEGDTVNGHNLIRLDLAMGVTIFGIRT